MTREQPEFARRHASIERAAFVLELIWCGIVGIAIAFAINRMERGICVADCVDECECPCNTEAKP